MEGRTAEYVGDDGVPWDRFARQVRLEPTARACYAALDDETRAWVSAYVDGVNEGMSGLGRAPELGLLGMRGLLGLSGLPDEAFRPRPWEPWTPLGIFWAIHLLFGTFPRSSSTTTSCSSSARTGCPVPCRGRHPVGEQRVVVAAGGPRAAFP